MLGKRQALLGKQQAGLGKLQEPHIVAPSEEVEQGRCHIAWRERTSRRCAQRPMEQNRPTDVLLDVVNALELIQSHDSKWYRMRSAELLGPLWVLSSGRPNDRVRDELWLCKRTAHQTTKSC